MTIRILHAHSTFALGGKEARAVRLMNAFGSRAEHVVLSSVPDALSARNGIAREIRADFPEDAPPLAGTPEPLRLLRLARYMRGFDLVLTYNWGAMDAVMAHRLFGGPPLVHHEDGFNADEADGLKPVRNLFRRLALGGAHRLVVPSRLLENIALTRWRQPPGKVNHIPNGVDLGRFCQARDDSAIAGLERRPGEIVVGTLAGLRTVKNLPRLVRAFAGMATKNARLVIVGEGPESDRIAGEARRLGIGERLLMPGFIADPAQALRAFDIFALSSDSEQMPISLMEAMAAGLPAAATAVGDVTAMVSADNLPLIVAPGDEAALTAALDTLAERADLRRSIGQANREKARSHYDEKMMIMRYGRLYGEAIGGREAFIADSA
jgi:glycosyltransferase involved in cell wall biosynthesis